MISSKLYSKLTKLVKIQEYVTALKLPVIFDLRLHTLFTFIANPENPEESLLLACNDEDEKLDEDFRHCYEVVDEPIYHEELGIIEVLVESRDGQFTMLLDQNNQVDDE